MAKTKLKDVALDAGVSIATASLVLSGKGNISKNVSQNKSHHKKIVYFDQTHCADPVLQQ